MIQRLNSYNLLTDKVAEKVPWTIYRPDKKAKKLSQNQKWTFPKGKYINIVIVCNHEITHTYIDV